MVFLLNSTLKDNKSFFITLRNCYGISLKSSLCIISKFGINKYISYKFLPEYMENQVQLNLDKLLEYVLKIRINRNLKHLEEIFYQKLINLKNYRSMRHRQFLPVRGQRTHGNAKTQKKKFKNRLKILKVKIKEKK